MRKFKVFIMLIFLGMNIFAVNNINEEQLKNKQFYLNKKIDFSVVQGKERKKVFIQTLVPIIEKVEDEIR